MSDDESESFVMSTDAAPSSGISESSSISIVPSCSESDVLGVEDTTPGRGPDDLSKVSCTSSNVLVVKFGPDDGPQGRIANFQRKLTEEKLAKNYHSLPYPTPIFYEDLHTRYVHYVDDVQRKKLCHRPILSFGWSKFMSYAAHFCKYEARNGAAEIVSAGSGDGAVDREIVAAYRKHFGEEIRITSIDPKPEYGADFKTVDDLIKVRPNVVRNCVVFIIWPEPSERNDGYDIGAIRKLQPLAVLTIYEPTEVSGSEEFLAFLHRETKEHLSADAYDRDPDRKFELDNYKAEEVVRQEVYLRAGVEYEAFEIRQRTQPASRSYSMRMARLRRTD